MSRNLIVAFTVNLTITCLALPQAPKLDFQSFTSAVGKFAATMPGKPVEETEEVDSPAGKLQVHSFIVAVPRTALVYTIAYIDYPATAASKDPQTILKAARDGMLGRPERKLIEDKELVLGKEKIPGRALLIEMPKLVYRARHFLAGRRLYQVVIVGSRDAVTSPDAEKYLDSFRTTK